MDAEKYVDGLFESQQEGMIRRAEWISNRYPQDSIDMAISCDDEVSIVFDDAQLCYIHGIFSGAIVLGKAFIEQSVCALAYKSSEFAENEKPDYHSAVKFLDDNDIVAPTDVEGISLNKLHKLKNPLIHLRNPMDESGLLSGKIERIRVKPTVIAPTKDEMLKEDAEKILKTCFSMCRTV